MKIYKLLFIFLILNACIGNKYAKDSVLHIGEWEGADYLNNTGKIVLNEDLYAFLTINGKKLGGDIFKVEGVESELMYTIDYSKSPIWIDFILYSKENKIEKGRLKGIIEFIDKNHAKMLLNSDGSRYENFSKAYDKGILQLTKKTTVD